MIMRFYPVLLLGGMMAWAMPGAGSEFTPLHQLPAPRVASAAEEYPGGNHRVAHLLDGDTRTEYSSNNQGVSTQVEFEFAETARLAGFRHVDRNDPATIGESELGTCWMSRVRN